jgi:hypothetical protein
MRSYYDGVKKDYKNLSKQPFRQELSGILAEKELERIMLKLWQTPGPSEEYVKNNMNISE